MNKKNIIILVLLILLSSFTYAQEFLETPNASYSTQTYPRGTGFWYTVGLEDLNLTSITKSSSEAGTTFDLYNNGTALLFTSTAFSGDTLLVGYKLNASTTYALMIHTAGCGNRNNAHDTGLSGSYPITVNKGVIPIAILSTAGCGAPEIDITGDGYSFDSWNVSIISVPSPTPTITLFTNLTNNTINYNFEELTFIYNATFTNNDNTFANISFFINDVHNITLLNINMTHKNIFNISFPDYSNWLNISINVSHGSVEDDTGYIYYNIDNINIDSKTTYSNNSQYSVLTVLDFYINFTDLNIFHYDISYYNPIGDLIKNITATGLSGTFAENSSSILLSNIGTYKIDVFAYDSHNPITKIHEKYKSFEEHNGSYKVIFEKGFFHIQDNNIEKIKLQESDNKYKEKIDFYTNSGTMIISSNTELFYVGEKNHKGHIVSLEMIKYRDLDSPDFHVIKVTKINKYAYSIDYTLDKLKITTLSIGDLNELHLTYFAESLTLGIATNNTGIENKLDKISGGIEMLGYVILIAVFVFAGIISRFYILWSISAMISMVLYMLIGNNFIADGLSYQKAGTYVFFGIAILLFFAGILLQIGMAMTEKKRKEEHDFYNLGY